MNETPFSYVDSSTPLLRRLLIRSLETISGARFIERLYLEIRRDLRETEDWWSACIRKLDVTLRIDAQALAQIPREGSLIFVSNHPFGVLDGIALASLVHRVRQDYRVLTNSVLMRAPEICDYVLPVDFSDAPEARKMNVASRAKAREHLSKGGTMIIFPAGAVSTSPDWFGRQAAVDAKWQPFVAQLAEKTQATIVPVHFVGQNSALFQFVSHIHPMLRLALFFHELRRKIGLPIDVRIGEPVAFGDLPVFASRQALADHLMDASYALRERASPAVD